MDGVNLLARKRPARLDENARAVEAYVADAPDPLALARAYRIPLVEVAVRLDVTVDWTRKLAADPRQAHRVRRAVLELALERERFAAIVGAEAL